MNLPHKVGPAGRFWLVPLITGIISIALGVWSLCVPVASLIAFAYLFSGLILMAGILNLGYAAFTHNITLNWSWSLVLGIFEIIAAVWMFMLPAEALMQTFLVIAGILILVGSINSLGETCLIAAMSGRGFILMLVALVVTIVLSLMFISGPIVGGTAVWLWISAALITFGIYRLLLAHYLRTRR